ncbi:FUSC family membrane protein [Apibacter sp. HY039]|uniref:FUSC family protein n=1 Tax=Apibacter sp. HY039 TaxID=2501476 RepID=UPI0013E2ABC0|nr:FUSC family membrane protein [Apibacter sp. HY039]
MRIAFVMLMPMIIGILFNRLDIGVLASSGALVAGIGDNPGTIKIKLYTQSIGAVFYFLVVLISQLLLPYTSHVVSFGLWVTFSGFFFSLLFIYGSRAVSISTSALLCIVYACSFQSHDIFTNTLAMMSGVVFYGIVSLGLWRIQPYRVIEQKLSENIKQLGEYTDLLYHYFLIKSNSPGKKQKLNDILIKIFEKQEKIHATHEDIRENLFRLRINAKSFSAKGRRMTLIFSALIDLYEQLISLNIQDDKLIYSLEKSGLKQDFTTGLLNMRLILDGINWSINLHKKVTITIDTSLLTKFKEHILNIENGSVACRDVNVHALKHVRFIFRSFYKQTQIIKSIINGNFNNEKTTYEDLQLEKFTQEYNYNFTTLKANLNLRSNIFRHALRVSMAILLSYFICIALEIKYFSWVYLTIILILKPVYGNTKNYAIQRLQGTAAGAVITLLLLLLTQNVYVITFLTVICIVGAYSFIPINYKVGVAFVTIFVILLIFLEHQGSDNWINIYHRLGGTAIAVIIAFILSFLFLPTWEYKILPTLISKLLNYNLNYFKKLTFNLQHEDKLSDTEVKLARKDVLLGTSNLSSSFQRIISEPSLSKDYKSDIYNIQTLINLLSTRISALRTYTFTSQKNTITETDNRLIQLIEQTLTNCISLIQNRNPGEESNWQEEEFNLNLNNQSLNTYQLKEIYILSQQIYNYVKKLKEFHEWKNSQFEFSL